MKQPLIRRAVATLALVALLVEAAPAGAAGSRHADIPRGATVLYFTSFATPVSTTSTTKGATVVTNAAVIAEIRSLIDALPLANTHRFCPADLLVPSYVSFAANATTAPFARVMFQLGGCPFARIYVHGKPVTAALGGPTLGTVFSKIKNLVEKNGTTG
jgi:hypothetical protein